MLGYKGDEYGERMKFLATSRNSAFRKALLTNTGLINLEFEMRRTNSQNGGEYECFQNINRRN